MRINEAIKKLAREQANKLGVMVVICWHEDAIRFYPVREVPGSAKELYQVVPEDSEA